ncbi:MAG: LPS-assembly protein LptD [Thermotogae bacterium]|nr:LPS-assembly protein LptD [Thermotogota bacterium]
MILLLAEVTFRGNFLEYFPDSGLVLLYDSAYVKTSEGTELWADTIKYWRFAHVVEASGNFVLKTPESKITGRYLKYNLLRQTGLACRSRTYVEKGWIVGDTVYKVSENSIYTTDGYFTTCELPRPHYRFVSNKMRVLKGDLAVVKPLVLYIRDLPILYAPFWFMPAGKERSSGFLPPSIGNSTKDGLYIRNLSFYLALDNFQDVTVFADIIEKRGVRFGLDYRYNVYKLLKGGFVGTYAYDLAEGGNIRRWSLKGDHAQSLLGFDLNAHADFVSDARYFQDYAEVPDRWIQNELVSYLTLRRRLKLGLLSINLYNRYEPVRNVVRRTLPEIVFNLLPLNVYGISLSNSFNLRREETDSSGNRRYSGIASSSHVLNTTYNLLHLNFSPSLFLNTIAKDSGVGNFLIGKKYGFRVPLSTTLYGVSLFGFWRFKKFRHILKPTVSYYYERTADSVIGLPGENRGLNIILDNTHEVKIRKDTVDQVKTLLQWSASTNYIFSDTLKDSSLWSRFTPITFSVRSEPMRRISIVATGSYDQRRGALNGAQIIFNFGRFNINELLTGKRSTDSTDAETLDTVMKDTVMTEEDIIEANRPKPSPWTFGFSYSYSVSPSFQSKQSILRFGISGSPTPNWFVDYSFTYDLVNRRYLDQSLSVGRDLHCWKLEARWSWFGGFSTYNVRIYVKAIPEIAVKRGVLDIFLPR